jgi:hypothetical protein
MNAISYFDGHEGAGVWLGALASLLVAVVAVAVPHVQHHLESRTKLQNLHYGRVLAFTAGLSGLKLLTELQGEAFERGRTGQGNPIFRDWEFELRAAQQAVSLSTMTDLRDPVAIERLVNIRLWLADARRFDLDSDLEKLRIWLQGNMQKRSEIWQGLQDMLKEAIGEAGNA